MPALIPADLHLLSSAKDAFSARLELIRSCRKSLDLQYYTIHDDITGKEIIDEILRAAARGVRVRLLVDNLYLGAVAQTLTTLNAHNNIQVRTFNPATNPQHSFLARMLNWLTWFDRYSKRMHNKALIADNRLAIIGGRNLGDEYFGIHSDFDFSDLDILIKGKVTGQITESFGQYWQSEFSVPLETFEMSPPQRLKRLRLTLYKYKKRMAQLKLGKPALSFEAYKKFPLNYAPFISASAYYIADNPEKVRQNQRDAKCEGIHKLHKLMALAKEEFIAVSPYLIPQEKGLARFRKLTQRGIKVEILTNSLASTDVSIVHACYSRYRKRLLEAGVRLFEFKPQPGKRSRQNIFKSASRSSLHAKVYIIDREYIVLGSFNLDPRSDKLNTEAALIIHSRELASQLVLAYRQITSRENSYRLALKPRKNRPPRIIWKGIRNGRARTYYHDPKPGLFRRVSAFLFYYLAPEGQL